MHLSQVRDESTLSANRNAVAPFSPGLAASATLGTSLWNPTARRLRPFFIPRGNDATALRLNDF